MMMMQLRIDALGRGSGTTKEEVDETLHSNMLHLYNEVYHTAKEYNVEGDLMAGANIVGFVRVAAAALRQGAV